MRTVRVLKWLIRIITNYLDNKRGCCDLPINYDLLNTNDKERECDFKYTKPSVIGRITDQIEIPDIKSKHKIERNKPTILMMDDYSGIISILLDDLSYLKGDVVSKLNVVYSDGFLAAFSVKKFLDEFKRKKEEEIELDLDNDSTDEKDMNSTHIYQRCKIDQIDIALLDITIGGFNYINDEMVEYDGIDIAKFIKEIFPECKIYFLTGHKPNKKHPKIFRYMEKFETLFNEEINSYIIPKNGNRLSYIKSDLKALLNLDDSVFEAYEYESNETSNLTEVKEDGKQT